jgi:1-acyl-sn-glycerol-3-phosphate acyltransferase
MAKAELFEKDLPKEKRVFYYNSEEDDPIKTEEQEKKEKVSLPEGYEFIPENPFVRLYAAILYSGFKVFARFYARFYLHMDIVGREKLKKVKGTGYVIYANHTNPFHDAFSPALVADRRIFTIISPVNLKLPGIGKFLPLIGGIPLGTNEKEKKAMNEAVDKRLAQKKCLVIYPEAHVWPYYTKIRKFPAGDRSFKYAVRNNLPVFTMTTTYHKSKVKGQERPDMTVYVDGPFYPDKKLSEDENRAKLAKEAYNSMVKWSKKSSYEYFEYKKGPKKK